MGMRTCSLFAGKHICYCFYDPGHIRNGRSRRELANTLFNIQNGRQEVDLRQLFTLGYRKTWTSREDHLFPSSTILCLPESGRNLHVQIICVLIFKTGFNAVIGSCNIIEISLPRRPFLGRALEPSMILLSKRIDPFVIFAVFV